MKSSRSNLVLCWILGIALLATLLSWIISFPHPHSLVWGRWGRFGIIAERGTLQFRHAYWKNLGVDAKGNVITVDATPDTVEFQSFHLSERAVLFNIRLSPWQPFSGGWIGLGGYTNSGGQTLYFGSMVDAWALAFWMLALPLAALFAWRARIEHARRRRSREGSCHVCGYDLRASPDRCPECGTETKANTAGAVR